MKKLFILAATAAMVLSSCSKNEVIDSSFGNDVEGAIALSTGMYASKSNDITTGELNAVGRKLTFYSDQPDFGGAGAGELEFTRGATTWTTTNNATWAGIGFPMNVYSMYEESETGGTNVPVTVGAGNATLTTVPYTIDNDVANHKDLIYEAQNLTAAPVLGVITAEYKHALCRVKMTNASSSVPAFATDYVKVQLMGMANSCDGATLAADAITWGTLSGSTEIVYDLANASTVTKDMYIFPETGKTFTYVKDSEALPSTYVEVLCYTDSNGIAKAGWSDVAKFKARNSGASVTKGGSSYTGPMYVKVVFPITDAITFDEGKYYSLNLNFDGSNMYYKENKKYYAADGTLLTVAGTVGTKEPDQGEPVNAKSDLIGLTVTVLAWDDLTGTGTPL